MLIRNPKNSLLADMKPCLIEYIEIKLLTYWPLLQMWHKKWFEIFPKLFFIVTVLNLEDTNIYIYNFFFLTIWDHLHTGLRSVCKPGMCWWKKNNVFSAQRWHRGILPKNLQSLHNWTEMCLKDEWIRGCYQLIGPELPAQEGVKPSMTNTTWNYRLLNVLTCNHYLPDHLWCRRDTISLWDWLSCCTD